MLYLLAALAVALVAALLVERRRHDTTTRELVAQFAGLVAGERAAYLEHIENLYQRIQAPQAAVVEHHDRGQVVSYPAVTPDDDEAHWLAQDITKEALAQIVDEHEFAERVA